MEKEAGEGVMKKKKRKEEEQQGHDGRDIAMTSGGLYQVEHQDGYVKLEETEESRAKAAEKKVQNQEKRRNRTRRRIK